MQFSTQALARLGAQARAEVDLQVLITVRWPSRTAFHARARGRRRRRPGHPQFARPGNDSMCSGSYCRIRRTVASLRLMAVCCRGTDRVHESPNSLMLSDDDRDVLIQGFVGPAGI